MPERKLLKEMNDFALLISEYIGRHKLTKKNVDLAFVIRKENGIYVFKEIYGKYANTLNHKINDSVLDAIPMSDRERIADYYDLSMNGKDTVFVCNGLFNREFLVWIHPIIQNGQVVEIGAYSIDISKWEKEERLVTVVDNNGIIKHANQSHTTHFGYRIDELIDTNIFDFQHPENVEMVVNSSKFITTEKSSQILSSKVRTKSGDWLHILSVAFPLIIDTGDTIGFITVAKVLYN